MKKKKTTKEDWVLPFKRTNNFRASKTPRNYVVQQANFSDKETEAKKKMKPQRQIIRDRARTGNLGLLTPL